MTTTTTLVLEDSEDTFEVLRFEIRDAVSSTFEVDLTVRTANDDLDFDAVVGRAAAFKLEVTPAKKKAPPPDPGNVVGVVESMKTTGEGTEADAIPSQAGCWSGTCASLELLATESTGLSTYQLRIVPRLWFLSQRRNYRVFQDLSAVDIALSLLPEGLEPELRLELEVYPKLEMRVQYGETDLAFFERMLEEAGVSYFHERPELGDDEDGLDAAPTLVLAEAPGETEAADLLQFVDNPTLDLAGTPFAARVVLKQAFSNNRLVIRDYDFRRSPAFALESEARDAKPNGTAEVETLENFDYAPGAFLVAGAAPDAAALDASRHDAKLAAVKTERALRAARGGRKVVSLETNATWLAPGATFAIVGHPRRDLAPTEKLLCTSVTTTGSFETETTFRATAVFAAQPFRPEQRTPKPKVVGVQSAIVVGPEGEEIHVDAYGRVRVRFHWDRENDFTDDASCWVRVSQGWAGAGYGQIALPRVGHEVLVGFVNGDPDQPIVEGRVFSATTRAPYDLPENKTVSTWKSASTGGAGGFNEIKFEDAAGREQVYVQAERDLVKLVKAQELETTGLSRVQMVGVHRRAMVGRLDATVAGVRHVVKVALPGKIGHRHVRENGKPVRYRKGSKPTRFAMVNDRIVLATTGGAKIVLEHDTIRLVAPGGIKLRSEDGIDVRAKHGDVVIQGGPMVHINPEKHKPKKKRPVGKNKKKAGDKKNEGDETKRTKKPGQKPEPGAEKKKKKKPGPDNDDKKKKKPVVPGAGEEDEEPSDEDLAGIDDDDEVYEDETDEDEIDEDEFEEDEDEAGADDGTADEDPDADDEDASDDDDLVDDDEDIDDEVEDEVADDDDEYLDDPTSDDDT